MKTKVFLSSLGFFAILLMGLISKTTLAEIIPSEQAHQLYAAANQLEEQGKTNEAKTSYQQVLDQYPNSPFAAGSRIHLSRFNVLSVIASASDASAWSEIADMITDFPDHPDIQWYIHSAENQYREAGKKPAKNVMQIETRLGAEDLQTYYNTSNKALWGRNCTSCYNESCSFGGACTSGSKDCRDPAQLTDGCPDYRYATSATWVGEAICIHLMGAETLWAHDPFWDYVDRWVTADVEDGGGILGDWYIRDMWNTYWPSGVVIVDNGQPGSTSKTGTWYNSAAPDPYSTGSLYGYSTTNPPVTATYTWTYTPPATGTYRVSMWWTALSTRSTSVPVAIQNSGDTANVNVNQTQNGGMWNILGDYPMNAGTAYNVTITAPTGSPPSTCADAVKFEYLY
jgi:hypothetical protein